MKPQLLAIIVVSVALSAIAQLCLKLGVGHAQARPGAGSSSLGQTLVAMLTSPWVIAGLGLYALGAVVWLFVLSRAPLSLAYPFVGLGFIMTAAIGVLVLGEQVTVTRMAGTLLIALGCVVVAQSA
jgi:multidrug transporter EmrE-like cation transporter